ncbi:MAG TPA: hypothetical protein VFP72_20525, partial [Kineosporiaceae bacterium]|nr:hypothetical protein [Kineosporiaceae bacterium]
ATGQDVWTQLRDQLPTPPPGPSAPEHGDGSAAGQRVVARRTGAAILLRQRLLGDTGGAPAPVPARAGADEPSGLADPGLLPGELDGWPDLADGPDHADWADLADMLERDDWLTSAEAAGTPPVVSGDDSGSGAGAGRAAAGGTAPRAAYAEALKVLREASLRGDDHHSVRVLLWVLFRRGDPVGGPAWEEHPELVGVFPTVPVLAVLPGLRPGRPDSRELADARNALGRQVVGALWRSVEAGTADPGNVAEVARQVAAAVTTQAPGIPAAPDRYSGVDRTLTAGVARAFIDQTLTALRETAGADAPVVGSVERLHRNAARTIRGLRSSGSQDGPRRVSWQTLLGEFTSGVDAAAGQQAWAHLRRWLLGDTGGVPAPVPQNAQRGEASAGVNGQLMGVEQEGLLARWILDRDLPQEGPEQRAARAVLKRWLDESGTHWPEWQKRPELLGVFPSVQALGALRWPDPNKQDSPQLVDLRDRLGRQVLGALWRSVAADRAVPSDVAEVAWRVAVGVTTQAPDVQGDRNRYSRVDRALTAGMARAFIDQTLTAVRETAGADAQVVGSVERLHQTTERAMVRFRNSSSTKGLLRVSWRRVLSGFFSRVDAVDRQVWTHLRDRLLTSGSRAPVPARPGPGEPSGQLPGPADPGLLPDNPDDWPDLADWTELADLLEGDWQELADPVDLPLTQPVAGSPGGPEASPAREPALDQGGPDPAWLRRLAPHNQPPSAPAPTAGQPPAPTDAPQASPPPDRTPTDPPPTAGLPPGVSWGGSRKRTRGEAHQPGSGGKRVPRQQESRQQE